MPNILYVDNEADLARMVDQCIQKPAVALDTEFIRTSTFYPKPALIQLYDGEQVYLLDPLSITDLSEFKRLLLAPNTVKVMHSCGEDLEVFSRMLDCHPTPLFDTQVAASLVGLDYSMSYQRIVDALLDKQLEKGETRSNWLQRPLSSRQLAYAVDDVLWLLDVHFQLVEQLETLNRMTWLREDCDEILNVAANPEPFDNYYQRVNSAWRLDGMALNVLRALCAWREQKARDENVPRSHIIPDAALMEISRSQPKDKAQLAQLEQVHASNVRVLGSELLSIVDGAVIQNEEQFPPSLAEKNSKKTRALVKEMKQATEKVAGQLAIPSEILARKRELEYFLLSPNRAGSKFIRGWRADYLLVSLERIVDASGSSN